jgi:NADPH:quinone reductase-like Zn-dependent oxidoreductase
LQVGFGSSDHVLELIGGDNLHQSLDALAGEGRIAQIGFLRSPEIALSAVPLMLRRATFQGVSVGHRRAFETMIEAFVRHERRPVIDGAYPFEDVHLTDSRKISLFLFGCLVLAR